MTTGEIFRFLDDGYPAGVQSALETHIMTCARCTKAVNRARQLRRSGHATLLATLNASVGPNGSLPAPDEPADTGRDTHLNAMTLARFVDGTAPDPERVAITEHLVDCPQCYRQFAGMSEELSPPPSGSFTTPEAARDRVRATPGPVAAPSPTPAGASSSPAGASSGKRAEHQSEPSRTRQTPGLLERMGTLLDDLFAPRWAVGLGGAVAGVLLALLVFGTPPDRVIVPLTGGSGSASGSGRVMSGMNPAPPAPAVTLPTSEPVFTWTALPSAIRYTVTITGDDGESLLETSTESSRWASPRNLLAPGSTYVLVVTADLDGGAVAPITRLRFQVSDG
jgi:anti-sigma factor RsiW